MTTATTPLRRLLLSGALWATAGRILAILAALGTNIALARALSPEHLGAFFLVWSTATFAVAVGTLGVDQVTLRWIAEARARGSARRADRIAQAGLALAVAGATLSGGAIALGAGWLFGRVFSVPQAVPAAGLIGTWIAANVVLRQLAEAFRGYQSIRLATLFNGLGKSGILPNAGLLVVAVTLWIGGWDSLPTLYAAATVVDAALIALGVWAWRRLTGRDARSMPATDDASGSGDRGVFLLVPSLWRTALPVSATAVVAAIRVQSDLWMLGALAGARDVAVYGAVLRLVLLVVAPLQIVNAVLPPIIAEFHTQGRLDALQDLLRTVATGMAAVSVVVIVTFAFLGGPILGLVYGPFFAAGAPLLLILAGGHLVNVAAGSCDFVLLMTGHERPFFAGTLLGALVLIALAWILGKAFGPIGVATAAAAALTVQNLFWSIQVRRVLGIWTHVTPRLGTLRRGVALFARNAGGKGAPVSAP